MCLWYSSFPLRYFNIYRHTTGWCRYIHAPWNIWRILNVFFPPIYLIEYDGYAGKVLRSLQLIQALVFFFHGTTAPSGPGPPHFRGFTITLRHTTLSKTPTGLVISLTQRFYLTTHNKHMRQTSMSPAGFELQIPICERLHTQDRVATGIGTSFSVL